MTNLTFEEKWKERFLSPDERAKEGDRYDMVNTLHRRYLPAILSRLGCRGGKGVDIGCGAGTYLGLLNQLGFDMIGIDYSFPMLKTGKERSMNRDTKFISANAYQLPLRDGSQDIVIAMGLLQLLTSIPLVLREMTRILKPGAILLCETRNKYSLFRYAQRVIRGNEYRTLDSQMHHFSPWHIKKALINAGFNSVRFHGFYVFPWPTQWVSSLMYRCKLDFICNAIFPVTNWLSHSFWISAIRSTHVT